MTNNDLHKKMGAAEAADRAAVPLTPLDLRHYHNL